MPDIPYKVPSTGETRYRHITNGQQRLMAKLNWEQTVQRQRAEKLRKEQAEKQVAPIQRRMSMPKRKSTPQITNLTLVSIDRNYWINTIKVVREVAALYGKQEFGLKESVDFVNEVRNNGKENTLLRNVSIAGARAAKRKLAGVGAKVRLGKFDSLEASNA